jgi:tetratricopeptide (TPR) repeat protein
MNRSSTRYALGATARRLACAALVACALVAAGAPPAHAQSREQVLARVGELMGQGRLEEALEVARDAPLDLATRETLVGMIALRAGAHERALAAFERALEEGPDRELIHLYMAWSHHALGHAEEARASLRRVKGQDARVPLYWVLRGRMERDAGRPARAYAVLREGHERWPEEVDLARELGFVLLETHGTRQARAYLVGALTGREDDVATWGDAMRTLRALSDMGQHDEALFYVDLVRARLPARAAELDALAAHLHARAGRPRVSAQLFARATHRGGASYAFEAADQHRVARQTEDALRWNQRVADPARRDRQRFLILTEGQEWARARLVGARLEARGELGDASARYRYGLALVLGARDLEGARAQAEAMGEAPEAARLLELIARCAEPGGGCR